jgi:hypothetical protein
MTKEVTTSDSEGNPEIIAITEDEADGYSEIADEVEMCVEDDGVLVNEKKPVGSEFWVMTGEGVISIDRDYRTDEFIIDLDAVNESIANSVADHIVDDRGPSIRSPSNASNEDVGEAITEEEYTTGVGVSGAPSSRGDIAAEITIYEDGTYDFNNKSGGRNHEAIFSAIVAVQDKKEDVLVPLIITEDGWRPGISGMGRIADAIKDAFRRSL